MGGGFLLLPAAMGPAAPPLAALWVATALYGFGCGPMFGACNSLPAQYDVQVTGTQMTLLQLGVSAGNTFGPFIVSQFFAVWGVGVLPWAVLCSLGGSLAALCSLNVCLRST
jgi:hypothetical protein